MTEKTIVGNVCFVRKGEKLLLLRRSKEPMKGKWTGVGGKTEFFEEPLESCVREVREETGLEIKPELIGIITTIDKRRNSKWFLFVYVADVWKGELTQCGEGVLEWINEERLYERELAFVGVSFPYLLNRRRRDLVTGKIIHDGERVRSCIIREGNRVLLQIPSGTREVG